MLKLRMSANWQIPQTKRKVTNYKLTVTRTIDKARVTKIHKKSYNSIRKRQPIRKKWTTDLTSYFSEEKWKMANNIQQMPNLTGILICIFLVTNKMPFLPIRLAKTMKPGNTTIGKDVHQKEPLHTCSYICQLEQSLWKTIGPYPLMLSISIYCDPAIPYPPQRHI